MFEGMKPIILVLQMELPIGNFFEVTINSNKLFSFMEDIMRKVDVQDARIGELTRLFGATGTNLDQKLKSQEATWMIELQKVKKMGQQDMNYLKLLVRDVDKKATDREAELEAAIVQLSTKINLNRTAIEEDLAIKLSYLEKKITNLTIVEELDKKLSIELGKINSKIYQMEESRQNEQDAIEQRIKRHAEINEDILERLNHPDKHYHKIEIENCGSISSSFREEENLSKSKRRNRSNRNDHFFQQLQGLSGNVGEKIDSLQNKMMEGAPQFLDKNNLRRSIISNNKVVKYHDNINKVGPKSAFGKKNENRIKILESALLEKLAKIEDLSINRISLIEKEMYRQANKSQIIDEHIGILSRKLQKEKVRINEVTETVKVANDRKVDEKTIQNIRSNIKKITKDFQEAIETKLQRDQYERERVQLIEKIQKLSEFITEKADKAEVKKGLSFLEQKIKEVIIVIAQQRAGHQDGAIKKTPFKCLSCDKDLQSQKAEALQSAGNNRVNKENSVGNLRNATSQMRKRIRIINNTVPTIISDD